MEIIITKEGEIVSEWWDEELDEFLDELGIPKTNSNRNPWCG